MINEVFVKTYFLYKRHIRNRTRNTTRLTLCMAVQILVFLAQHVIVNVIGPKAIDPAPIRPDPAVIRFVLTSVNSRHLLGVEIPLPTIPSPQFQIPPPQKSPNSHTHLKKTTKSTPRNVVSPNTESRIHTSWIPQHVWSWKPGNTTRSQLQSDGTFTGCQSKLVFVSRWMSSQETDLWVKLQSTWPSSAALSTRSRRGATYDRRHKFSS